MVPRDYNPEDFFTDSDGSSDPNMYDGTKDRVKVLKKKCRKRRHTGKGLEEAKYLRYLSQEQIDLLREVEKKCDKGSKRKHMKSGITPQPKRTKGDEDESYCPPVESAIERVDLRNEE